MTLSDLSANNVTLTSSFRSGEGTPVRRCGVRSGEGRSTVFLRCADRVVEEHLVAIAYPIVATHPQVLRPPVDALFREYVRVSFSQSRKIVFLIFGEYSSRLTLRIKTNSFICIYLSLL